MTEVINLQPRKTIVIAESRKTIVLNVPGVGGRGPVGPYIQSFTLRDNPLIQGIGAVPFEWPLDGEVIGVRVIMALAPTGQNAIFNVRKNGVVWFTIAVPAGTRRSGEMVPADTEVLEGDESTVDVAQIGNPIPGAIATFIFEVASQ